MKNRASSMDSPWRTAGPHRSAAVHSSHGSSHSLSLAARKRAPPQGVPRPRLSETRTRSVLGAACAPRPCDRGDRARRESRCQQRSSPCLAPRHKRASRACSFRASGRIEAVVRGPPMLVPRWRRTAPTAESLAAPIAQIQACEAGARRDCISSRARDGLAIAKATSRSRRSPTCGYSFATIAIARESGPPSIPTRTAAPRLAVLPRADPQGFVADAHGSAHAENVRFGRSASAPAPMSSQKPNDQCEVCDEDAGARVACTKGGHLLGRRPDDRFTPIGVAVVR